MHRRDGFSAFELMIVLLLLLVVAGVTVPQYFYANAEANEAALLTDLQAVRAAIEAYHRDHDSKFPGLLDETVTDTTLARQLMRKTDADGRADLQGAFGPYLPAGIPVNPFNGMDTVKMVTRGGMPACDDSTGWIYHQETGAFKANCSDRAPSGALLGDL